MLSESSRFATIEKLKALAEHPNTPPDEAENAKQRISEILDRIERERAERKRTQVRSAPKTPASIGRMADSVFKNVRLKRGIKELKKRRAAVAVDAPERTMKDEWPFGWTGPKAPVEYEAMRDSSGDLIVGWKCPGCGGHVTRVVNRRAMLRAEGQRGGIDGFIRMLTGGTVNQLCWDCWRLWNNK